MHIVFVDFRKAFDLVDHAILLTKLGASGVNRGFWKWTQSFLTGRTLQVKLPGALSKMGQVIAGVPQGGVISPMLFNVHINDVDKDIPSSLGIKSCKFAERSNTLPNSTLTLGKLYAGRSRWGEIIALFGEVFLTIFPWSFKEYRTVV